MNTSVPEKAKWPIGFLFALTSFPALAVLLLFQEGRVVAVLYDEPKLHITHLVGGSFLFVFAWIQKDYLPTAFAAAWKHPFFLTFGAFITWGTTSTLWSTVPHNTIYELKQYFFLFVLLLALFAWAQRDHRVPELLLHALVLALVPVTFVSYLQLTTELSWLPPIDPGYEVRHPSFLGYKNPMALALLGQIFLLIYLIQRAFAQRRWTRWPLGLYGAAQVACLATLQSRTSYVTFLMTVLALSFTFVFTSRHPSDRLRMLAITTGFVLFFGILLAKVPSASDRVKTLLPFLSNPASYFESDRGTYLLNTLNMVQHNPLGVGLGDWQTHYPVYRLHNRYVAFTEEIQTRRAHSDYLQLLGELGPLGLGLWAGFLLHTFSYPWKRFWRKRCLRDLLICAQLFVLFLAMVTDTLLDLPYSRLQFFLVCALAILPSTPQSRLESVPNTSGIWEAGLLAIVGAVCIALGILGLHYSSATFGVRFHHERASVFLKAGKELRAWESLMAAQSYTRRLDACCAYTVLRHSKTSFRTEMQRAQIAWWLGDPKRGLFHARAALASNPFHPNIFLLLSNILAECCSENSIIFAQVSDYVMHEATIGFQIRYPTLTISPQEK